MYGSDQNSWYNALKHFVNSGQQAANEERLEQLFRLYGDQHYVHSAPKEFEEARNSATKWGIGSSLFLFAANEATRLSFRSRKSPLNFYFHSHIQSSLAKLPHCLAAARLVLPQERLLG